MVTHDLVGVDVEALSYEDQGLFAPASWATLALNAGEWVRLGLLGMVRAPPGVVCQGAVSPIGVSGLPGHFCRRQERSDRHLEYRRGRCPQTEEGADDQDLPRVGVNRKAA